jgi:hypothetical protein
VNRKELKRGQATNAPSSILLLTFYFLLLPFPFSLLAFPFSLFPFFFSLFTFLLNDKIRKVYIGDCAFTHDRVHSRHDFLTHTAFPIHGPQQL